jgi:L-threonylcarbamoyladenylate synthase
LVATSANVSGEPAPARPEEVDRAVLGEDIPLVSTRPWPTGGKPSTIVVVERGAIRVLREGAVPRTQLAVWGEVV